MNICPTCHQEIKKIRTQSQNKLYFSTAVKVLADHYQVEKEIMHKALAGAFFGFVEIDLGQGLTMKAPASTKGRTTREFKEFYEYIQKIASERGLDVHSNNEPPLEDR